MTSTSADGLRRTRLKAALRENLKRRKGQVLSRQQSEGAPETEPREEDSPGRVPEAGRGER